MTMFISGNYRAEVVDDSYAYAPTNCGLAPTLRYESYNDASPFDNDNTMTAEIAQHAIDMADALRKFTDSYGEPLETFKRYLHIFHGVEYRHIWEIEGGYRDASYISWATPGWIEACGITDLDRLAGENMLEEVESWRNGEVYGVIISERVTYVRTVDGQPIMSAEHIEWEEVDSCYGFYGSDYAEDSARGELARHAGVAIDTIKEEA